MNSSLKNRILDYYKRNHTLWIPSVQIERLAAEHTTHVASNAGRRLRDLFEEGKLDREYRIVNGKKLAYYKAKETYV